MAYAKIEKYHGEPAIMIDGVPYPPMTVTVSIQDKEYLRDLGEAGLKIFYVDTSTRWNRPGGNGQPDGITGTLRAMDLLFSAVPDAYVMLRLNVSPSREWVEQHPEEQVTFNDGSHKPVICTSVSGQPLSGMFSLTSHAWWDAEDAALQEYFDELEQHPYFKRIIGVFLCSGGTSEWYYPGQGADSDAGTALTTPKKGLYGDFSEPFRKEFSRYLREKYGTEEELRRVWKRPDAGFDHPIIPNLAERGYITEADAAIQDALEHWETVGYTVGQTINMDAEAEGNIGVFLNANRNVHAADFFSAWHEGTANSIVHFAEWIKNRYEGLLIGAFYGSYGCTDYFEVSTATGTLKILDSGKVDFLAAPGTYNNREPGGAVAQREMQDSLRIRNQIYICEDDARTHRCLPTIQREAMGLCSVQDSVTTLKRDFARDICEEISGWWFDMGSFWGSDASGSRQRMERYWYNDPEILALFRRQREIADFAYSLDRTKRNEIALIYDTESVHFVSEPTDRLVLDLYRTSDIPRIGAPVDYYFHNDLSRPDMPDYKLYVMLNQYYLSDAEREAVFAKARKNRAVVLWLYAPGFINPNAEPVQALENIEKTVGMHLGMRVGTSFPYFKITDAAHPALRYADSQRRYGYIDRSVHSNIWIRPSELPPTYVNPAFYIEDDAVEVLGRYGLDGKTAYALREYEGFTSAYCCAQTLRSDLIASLAAYAGCHIFSADDDVLYANENFVCIHAKERGRHRIAFKRTCNPYEVYEKRFYGENVDHIELDMVMGETKMFSTNGGAF